MGTVPVKKHVGSLASVAYDLYVPSAEHAMLPLVIFLNGGRISKDRGNFPDAFIEITRKRYAVLVFDSASPDDERADLDRLMEHLHSGRLAKESNVQELYPVGLIGFDRGGITAIQASAERDDIMSLVTINSRSSDEALAWVGQLYIPCCFIHAHQDAEVSYKESDRLYLACSSREKDRILIEKADHWFGASDDYDKPELPAPFLETLDHTIRWFQSTLV